jgi:probable HAF family extracellular repeat protein
MQLTYFVNLLGLDGITGKEHNSYPVRVRRTFVSSRRLERAMFTLLLLVSAAWGQTSPYNQNGINQARDINGGGTIPLTDERNGKHAFEWRFGQAIPLSLLGGTCGSARGVSNAGHIVGGACPPGDPNMHAYIYRSGVTRDLGTMGGIAAEGIQVNRTDEIAGDYKTADGFSRGFFRRGKHWVDLGSLGGSFTFSLGMNKTGVVAGQSDVSNVPDPVYGIPPFHGFVWSAGTLTDVGAIFGSNFNYLSGIGDGGVAPGGADLAGDTAAHAILWNSGTVQDLSPDGNISAGALDVNNLGQAVGLWGSVDTDPADGPPVDSVLCPCYAVLWQDGQEIFLNGTVSPEWNLWLALAINDRGEIVARGQFNGGTLQTVLLKPLPPSDGSVGPIERTGTFAPKAIVRDARGRLREVW